ncbi:hypothetical protein MMC07_004925 [Pseudocyphellaria aurata]|nr:hypothetical protein [Pseudocyphellaria aurata]
MVDSARISIAHGRRRTYRSGSQRARIISDDRNSDRYSGVERPSADKLRRARAEFHSRSPEERRREGPREMEHYTSRRRTSRVKQSSFRAPEVIIREERRRHEPERRHHRRKPREEGGAEGYVYRYVDDDQESKAADRHQHRRRSAATVMASRDDSERVRVSSASLSRRNTVSKVLTPFQGMSSYPYPNALAITFTRSHSMRETRAVPAAQSLKRSQTTTRKARRSSFSLSTPPIIEETMERKPSSAKKNERSPTFFGSIFGTPKATEPVPEKQIECLTCLSSDIPISKSAKLACTHRMCHSCLRRIFTLSVTDPQHMPPKCCTQDHIPLKHVEKLFDLRFKKKWNHKYQEYTTKNRIYCPAKGCGEWIKPANIHVEPHSNRKYGKCNRCRTKVCTTCNGKWHTSRECPKDEATLRFAEIAKKEGWQRCHNCSATVELKEGCNHMTCRCRAEFCMICGSKWKTCDCPWFNYAAVENDRLNHMNPVPRRAPLAGGVHNPALGYQEELDRRREQERRDEALARRMQVLGLDALVHDTLPDFFPHPPAPPHHLFRPHPPRMPAHAEEDQDFVRRAAAVLSAPIDDPADNPVLMAEFHHRQRPPRIPPPVRQHSTASGSYNNRLGMRPSERVVPRRVVQNDYASEAARHRPFPDPVDLNDDDVRGPEGAGQSVGGGRRHSALAGLTSGTVEGRVDQWRRHHSTASGAYNNRLGMRPGQRVVPRRMVPNDYASEAARHRPFPDPVDLNDDDARGPEGVGQSVRRHRALAGLTNGTVEGRVDQWRRHVGDE